MSIKKLETGRWRVDVEPVKGKRFRKTFDTKAEALRFEAHKRLEANQADWNSKKQDNRRLSELIEIWHDLHGVHLRDIKKRLARLKAISKALNNPIANKLTPAHFAKFRGERIKNGISPRTVNNDLCFLKALYNELFRLQELDYQNPLALVKPLQQQEQALSFLTHQQINELLEQCQVSLNPHVYFISLICLATGCRWGEAENVTAQKIKLGAITFQKTKSNKVRSVPVSPELIQQLKNHWNKNGNFTSSMNAFRKALSRCSFTLPAGQATHILRHTFASHFVQLGGNLLVLQKILGHSTINMTMRYAHLAPDHLQEALRLNPLENATLLRHLSDRQKKTAEKSTV